MNQARYTVILEFRGGTYVSQVEADDERRAMRQWADRFAQEKPAGRVSSALAKAFVRAEVGSPVPLDGLTDVWCVSALCGGDLALGNIVRSA